MPTATTFPRTTTMTTATIDLASLYRLLTWMSPAYPLGAYTYSHGLEWCVEQGDVHDAASALAWIAGVTRHGAGRCDAILMAHAWRATTPATVAELAELAVALCPSAERRLELTAQGRAFLQVTRDAWPHPGLALLDEIPSRDAPLPVVAGVAAAAHGIDLGAALPAALHAFAGNLVSAAVRLVPLGQTQGQRLMAALEAQVRETAAAAAHASLDELASATLRADIASMQHETQYSRLFRS